jgi:hypothetical protein
MCIIAISGHSAYLKQVVSHRTTHAADGPLALDPLVTFSLPTKSLKKACATIMRAPRSSFPCANPANPIRAYCDLCRAICTPRGPFRFCGILVNGFAGIGLHILSPSGHDYCERLAAMHAERMTHPALHIRVAANQWRRFIMNLAIWLPALIVLGLAAMALMFAFLHGCDKV